MAEKLHDALSKQRFQPFIDRFHIDYGDDVQARIAEALEDYQFLLLLESPSAHKSKWVFWEADYAIAHQLAFHIVSWPGVDTLIPGTDGLPRQELDENDLVDCRDHKVLSTKALDEVLTAAERAHAIGLVRRRRSLLLSLREAAEAAGKTCTSLEDWRLLVEDDSSAEVVGVMGRLPRCADLFALQQALDKNCSGEGEAVLVHGARRLPSASESVLKWAVAERPFSLVPSNAIGAYW
jgi:hypothetical protein